MLDDNLADGWNRSLEESMLPGGWSAVAVSVDHDDLANGQTMMQLCHKDGKVIPLN